jgi:glutamate-1-semialdehyde 2,1-aminomutase
MAVFDPRTSTPVGHGGTFSANPVTMRAGLAAMELFTPPEVERINGLGDRLREALGEQGWTVTGNGSLLRVHVDDATDLWWRAYREGLLLSVNGLACISTPMRDSDIDFAIGAFARVREQEGAQWNV